MPLLTVLVPIYNEEATLAKLMGELTTALPNAEIVYIDDGSRDKSHAILLEEKRPQDIVIHKENGGKGSAIREGIKHVSGEYCVIQDADLEYDPKEILLLLAEAKAHPNTVVFGSRFLKRNPNIYPLYLLGNKTLTGVLNLLFSGNLTDAYTCYKLFPTNMLRTLPLSANGFELEAELTAYPLKFGYSVRECPISYHPRSFEQGKKINWKDAVKGILTMIRIRYSDDHSRSAA